MGSSLERRADVRFRVYGIPQSQGSMRAFMPKGGRFPVVTHAKGPKLNAWRTVVHLAAPKGDLLLGPLSMTLVFYMPIPKSRPPVLRTAKQIYDWAFPWKKPDPDKMLRAIFDALTGVVYNDDSQIVDLHLRKEYGADPGVEVWVGPMQQLPA